MRKKLFFTIAFLTCLFFTKGQSIPDRSFQTIEGDTMQLSSYQGKKFLFIVLPVSHSTDDSLSLISIDSSYRQYRDSIVFIGVPSYEDGFADSTSADIRSWYRDTLHLGFTITTGMYTKNSSGIEQSAIFQWLTNESLNGHFTTAVETYGQKFLLNESGELKAVFDQATPLSNRLMDIIVGM